MGYAGRVRSAELARYQNIIARKIIGDNSIFPIQREYAMN